MSHDAELDYKYTEIMSVFLITVIVIEVGVRVILTRKIKFQTIF